MKTHEKLAREFGVSPSTILRDAAFVRGLRLLAKVFGDDLERQIMAEKSDLNKSDVILLGRLTATELASIGESGLKARAREIKQAKAAPRRLPEAQRAYLRLDGDDRLAYLEWLARVDGEGLSR